MSPFFRLICDFEVLTPLYLGGASQQAELRAASIKGAMRFWYRALAPRFQEHEPCLFGSGGAEATQSLLRVRCRPGERAQDVLRWRDVRAEQLNQGAGPQTRNGLVYIGYPFGMRGNEERTAIRPGARFSVEVSCHRPSPAGLAAAITPLRAALAAMWALGHFGALGTRARRGFGALALLEWRAADRDGQPLRDGGEMAELPLLHRSASPGEWLQGAADGLAVLRRWFGTFADGAGPARPRSASRNGKGAPREAAQRMHHPHFGPRADFTVSPERARREDWRGAVLALSW